MADVAVNVGPQNMVQPKPKESAVLANTALVSKPNTPPLQAAPSAASSAAVPPKSSSPWDDELELPPAPVLSGPTVIGSLDPKAAPLAAPAPLKLPENMEEQVGKKIPATNFIDSTPSPATVPGPTPVTTGAVMGQVQEKPQAKKSSGILGGLFKKNTNQNKSETPKIPPITSSAALPAATVPAPSTTALGTNPAAPVAKADIKQVNPLVKKILILIPGLIVVFALATFLTEEGLLSIGIENIYGAAGVEQLWGGLSPKTELALGRSALTMQKHPDFKGEGKISVTIDQTIKSDIVTPLLSLTTGQSLARDESINLSQKAIKTASDSTDDYYFTDSDSDSNDNSNSSSGSSSSSSSTTSSNSNSNRSSNSSSSSSSVDYSSSSSSSSSSATGDVNDESSSQSNENSVSEVSSSGTKSVEGVFSLKASSSSNEASIKLNDSQSSTISLVNDDNKLLVKTSGAVNYGTTDRNQWLSFDLDQLKGKSLITNLFNLNVDSGFSVKGARVGNEKVGNARCYKYKIDSLEIGSSLSNIGITSDMVPTLSGDVWIGVKDKLIHKMSIKITTPVSSAVRMVNVDMNLADFDVKNSITKVSSSQQIAGTAGQNLTGDSKRKADAKTIMAALNKYKTDNKSYPVSASFLKLNTSDNAIAKALVPRYLTSLPEDPNASLGWYYAYKSEDGTKCTVSAKLENSSDADATIVNNVPLYFEDSSD